MIFKIKEKIGDNLLLAIIPVLGYIVALSYEYGYANYFGYPKELIVVDLEMTLSSSLIVAIYLWAIVVALQFYSSMFKKDNFLTVTIRYMFLFSILPFFGMFASAFDPVFVYLFLFSNVIALLFCIISPLFHMKNVSYYEAYLKCNSNGPVASGSNDGKSNFSYGVVLFILIILIAICSGAGRMSAEDKKSFHQFTHSKQDYILVAEYSGKIIGAYFDAKAGKYSKEFSIFDPSKQSIEKIHKVVIKKVE